MYSIRELYRIGRGPSSSHTMGPEKAVSLFRQHFPEAHSFRIHLFGSLAATGKGHLTDVAIQRSLAPLPVEFHWHPENIPSFHPNGMSIQALDSGGSVMGEWEVFSVGGGQLCEKTLTGWLPKAQHIYNHKSMKSILKHCTRSGQSFWEYVQDQEGPDIWSFLNDVWLAMQSAMARGLQEEGVLPGGLGLARRAWVFHRQISVGGRNFFNEGLLPAYALAVAEENASGGIVVTAPTCGSCGIVPAVLRYVKENTQCSDLSVLRALATAGLIGNLVKQNGSISGAEVGCQGEVGVACAMAAGAAAQLLGGTPRQIEYAAEMGLEHNLGLTCDPVNGMVQIPCIERNVFAAAQALTCARYACATDGSHRVSFDEVVAVMKQTGHDLPSLYRETSSGGLATAYRFPPK